ncbi:hypothetical protein DVA86_20105 [Streptomyces armeniacus]|uniref:PPM-type phosphatase domain-containing protein n=2 Tax=Streptomyces armeniacus TaxID=83291 RepID=A0A345Y0S8_9ACTN|nr:hypothetical protein DVA86_20105 [Streptomyces armeniacus]
MGGNTELTPDWSGAGSEARTGPGGPPADTGTDTGPGARPDTDPEATVDADPAPATVPERAPDPQPEPEPDWQPDPQPEPDPDLDVDPASAGLAASGELPGAAAPDGPPAPPPTLAGSVPAPVQPADSVPAPARPADTGEPLDMLPPAVGPLPVHAEPPGRRAEPGEPWAAEPTALSDLVSDTVLDGARHGPLTLRAASLRGDSARERGEPRRDALLVARFGTGDDALLLVAVATGAGPAPGAHRAAREACQSIGEAIGRSQARLAEDIRAGQRAALKSGLKRLTDRSHGKLRAQAAALGLEPGEHSADLRCLLLPADPDCRTRVFFGIGTGGLFRLRGGVWQDIEPRASEAQAVGGPVVGFGAEPPPAPDLPGLPLPDPRPTMNLGITTPEARALPADPEPFRFRASVAHPGDTLLLCSSGLAEPLRASTHFADRLAARWADQPGAPDLAAFLAEVQQRAGDDEYGEDRTAAAVWEG